MRNRVFLCGGNGAEQARNRCGTGAEQVIQLVVETLYVYPLVVKVISHPIPDLFTRNSYSQLLCGVFSLVVDSNSARFRYP